ncbi:phenylalanine--tRNA ligase subunit beta [Anaerolineales bacterium HSG25]|nr:phenylalanine--tRNA ligase subunit beta [Anaerolineales bacterium HSG25]
MKLPISWLKDYVDVTLSPEELAERLTLAGLEVGKIEYVGVKGADLEWERDKLVLGHVLKVEQHPDADKLVLATVDIGQTEPEVVVTGAPNLFEFIGQGDISARGLKSPFVMEGAYVYDGHSKEPGKKMKLKGRKVRGIMNRHMLCSEKELGLSDDHEGIILTDSEPSAPGTPLVDIWGDVVLDIDLTPNLVRCASIIGMAREVAALTGQTLRFPDLSLPTGDTPLSGSLNIETTNPELNPRFVAILIEGIEVKPSPYWMQRRLRLAGMRPISNIVDVSNYVMLETGQPNHAFDWDVLCRRRDEYEADGPVKIITRLAEPDEEVLTLDDKTHKTPDYSILVTDPKSNLSIGGVMGGGESEVSDSSTNILLEAAAWNFINVRRTSQALNIYSEAAYRFSRGIPPAQAMVGALRGAQLMLEVAGGRIGCSPLDYYPNPPEPFVVELPQSEVTRALGIELSLNEIRSILESLEFTVTTNEQSLSITVPDHRMDIPSIGSGGADEQVIGRADLVEEIARIYGYDRIPVTEMADELPPQRDNVPLLQEERVRDLLVRVGLQEAITYRLTTPEDEARLGADERPYITLANPSTPERVAMRHSLLNSILAVGTENSKHQNMVQMFEIGQIYLPNKNPDEPLPDEQRRLAIVLTGAREQGGWLSADNNAIDFYDLKGVVEALLDEFHLGPVVFAPSNHNAYHPGRVAELQVKGKAIGLLGQLHPLIVKAYGFKVDDEQPVLAADFDLDLLLDQISVGHRTQAVPRFPAVQQDIAIVVDETIPAEQVKKLIVQTGGKILADATLFDVFTGDKLGAGKKSLAYSLTFQDETRTLTDKLVAKQQKKILQRLERELGASLRS